MFTVCLARLVFKTCENTSRMMILGALKQEKQRCTTSSLKVVVCFGEGLCNLSDVSSPDSVCLSIFYVPTHLSSLCLSTRTCQSFHVTLPLLVSLYLPIYLSLYLSIDPPIHLSPYPSIRLAIYAFTCLPIYLSLYPPIHPSIHPSLYLSIYRSIYKNHILYCLPFIFIY